MGGKIEATRQGVRASSHTPLARIGVTTDETSMIGEIPHRVGRGAGRPAEALQGVKSRGRKRKLNNTNKPTKHTPQKRERHGPKRQGQRLA